MDIDFNTLLSGLKSVTPDELAEAHNNMLLQITDWVEAKYPQIRLKTVERNLAVFLEIKKYDDACRSCMSTQQCPTLDGNRMNGRLDADGVVTIWMEACPKGHRPPKGVDEKREVKRWAKKQ